MKSKQRFLKRIAALLAVIAAAALPTGCFPTGENPITTSENAEEADWNQSNSEKITYDFQKKEEPKDRYPILAIERKIWSENDREQLYDFFIGNRGTELKRQLHQQSMYIPEEDFYYLYALPDDTTLLLDAGMVSYVSAKSAENGYMSYSSYYRMMLTPENGRKLFPKTEVSSFTSLEAEKTMETLIGILGVSVNETPEIYAIDEETVNQFKIPLPFDQELYLIVYTQKAGELALPDFPTRASLKDEDFAPFAIFGIFSQNGLESFECSYAVGSTEMAEEAEVCSAEAAAAVVKSRFESIVLKNDSDTLKITGCDLLYTAENVDGKEVLKPTWLFVQETETASIGALYDEILVDAQTCVIR